MRTAALAIALLLAACWDSDLGGARFACPDGRCLSGQACVAGRCQPIPGDAGPPPAWWDDAYASRRRLRIYNRSEEPAAAGLPVVFRVEFADLGIPDVDEMEVVYHDGVEWQRLPMYWVYQERFVDAFWFRLPAEIPPLSVDDGAWLYAGNPAAPPRPTDGETVWEQHDYFDSVDPTWETSGDAVIVSGDVQLGPGGLIRSRGTWPVDHAVDVAITAPAWGVTMSIGFQRSEDLLDEEPLARWAYHEAGFAPELEVAAAGQARWEGDAVIVADERVELGVDRTADSFRWWLRQEVAVERELEGGAEYLEPLQIRMANTSDATFAVAQLRVRRTMAPLPEVTVGATEPRP